MKTIEKIDLKNKKVILRVDYNVPIKDGKIVSDNRIVESLKTINYLLQNNCSIILLSHLGKIKTEEDKSKNSLKVVGEHLSSLLNIEVKFSEETRGGKLEELVNSLQAKEILLVENTRYEDIPNKLESECDKKLSKYWASLGDVFILDAFGTSHRAHASTRGISDYLPHAVGYLIEKEINILNEIINENKTLILGGAKVSDKIGVIKNLLDSTDKVLVGGAMCATFLKANGVTVGKTFVDEEKLDYAKEVMETGKIIIPVDVKTENGIKDITTITNDESIFDIGPKTIELFTSLIDKNKLVVMNGTMGLYENEEYKDGTDKLFEYLINNNIKTIICGGDTGSAAEPHKSKFYHISTGGGASLEYLEGKILPALEVME